MPAPPNRPTHSGGEHGEQQGHPGEVQGLQRLRGRLHVNGARSRGAECACEWQARLERCTSNERQAHAVSTWVSPGARGCRCRGWGRARGGRQRLSAWQQQIERAACHSGQYTRYTASVRDPVRVRAGGQAGSVTPRGASAGCEPSFRRAGNSPKPQPIAQPGSVARTLLPSAPEKHLHAPGML